MSNSLWPLGLQPSRLLCPRNSPGKNMGVGYHSFLHGIFLMQGSPALAGRFFIPEPPGKPIYRETHSLFLRLWISNHWKASFKGSSSNTSYESFRQMSMESPPRPPPFLKLMRILCTDYLQLKALAYWYPVSFSPCETLGEDLSLSTPS